MIKIYGDIMLDRWIYGSCERVSPEAPVIVMKEDEYNYSIGGAGNLATNLDSINGDVELYSCVAKDKEGDKLLELLKKTNINFSIKLHMLVLCKSLERLREYFIWGSSHGFSRSHLTILPFSFSYNLSLITIQFLCGIHIVKCGVH